MSRTGTRVLGCLLGIAVLGGACSSGGSKEGTSTPTTIKYDESEGVNSSAATLRAEVTTLLQEHVLLTGITTDTKLAGKDVGPPSAVLDQNATAIGAVVTKFYGDAVGTPFLEAWGRHTAGLVAFADVAASTEKAAVDKAKADLTAIQAEIVKIINTANPQITPEAFGEALAAYATKVQAAITAQAKKDPDAPTKLKEAADDMAGTAIVVVAGIVKQKKDEVPGRIDSVSAVMRTTLATKLQEHVYLAGLTTGTILGGGDAAPVTEALDENSLDLSRTVGSVYGDDAAQQFLELWRRHISLFADFTKATGANDAAKAESTRSALDAYSGTLATFLNNADPELPKAEVAQDLAAHIASLLVAIEAQAAGDPGQVNKLRDAAMHMPGTALLLATGIARQNPSQFG